MHKAQADDRGEEHDLPVEQAGTRQVAANQAKDALIDERRKRPDIVFIERHGAQLPGEKSAEHMEWQSGPFPVEQSGNTHQRAAERTRPAPADHAQQQRSLKAQIACLKTGLRNADQDADHDRQPEPEHEKHFLPEGALFAKQKGLEFFGTHQTAGNGRSYAQLDQQIDQDEAWFHKDAWLFENCSMNAAISSPCAYRQRA